MLRENNQANRNADGSHVRVKKKRHGGGLAAEDWGTGELGGGLAAGEGVAEALGGARFACRGGRLPVKEAAAKGQQQRAAKHQRNTAKAAKRQGNIIKGSEPPGERNKNTTKRRRSTSGGVGLPVECSKGC